MVNEQIKELAKDICSRGYCNSERQGHCRYGRNKYCWDVEILAKELYEAGYRKVVDANSAIPTSEWISVEDRLPEANLHVLLYAFFHNQWQIVKGWHSYCDKQFHITNSDYPSLTDIPVTHWMPLPEAPKGGE